MLRSFSLITISGIYRNRLFSCLELKLESKGIFRFSRKVKTWIIEDCRFIIHGKN